ncbi:hypothetical protein ABEF95_010916 [Exophiala dermatitidis]
MTSSPSAQVHPLQVDVEFELQDHNAGILLSPPASPFSDAELPAISTDDLGMIVDDEVSAGTDSNRSPAAAGGNDDGNKSKSTRTRRKITYVSKHFVKQDLKDEAGAPSSPARNRRRANPAQRSIPGRRKKSAKGKDNHEEDDKKEAEEHGNHASTNRIAQQQQQQQQQQQGIDCDEAATPTNLATPPVTPARSLPRIYYGLNVDDLSSDSSLTDVPNDIGPDPFPPEDDFDARPSSTVQAVKVSSNKKISRRPTKSPYFPHPHKHRPTFLSTLPFPALSHDTFGLMQERLAHDPFRLLIATIFLNKTPGERAMPVFYQLMTKYPTPAALADANVADITPIIYGLGFQNQRARKCVAMATAWVTNPPQRGKRYRKLNYPRKGDGKDVREGEVLDDDEHDQRVAWEISHLPGLGPYSHDSWRIFCRDQLRGVQAKKQDKDTGRDKQKSSQVPAKLQQRDDQPGADPDPDPVPAVSVTAEKATTRGVETGAEDAIRPEDVHEGAASDAASEAPFEPEWKRVVPLDKELRAYLTWMWLKEGWVWNKETGQRTKAPEELLAKARGGGIIVEERGSHHLAVKKVDFAEVTDLQNERQVERTAGDYLPANLNLNNQATT